MSPCRPSHEILGLVNPVCYEPPRRHLRQNKYCRSVCNHMHTIMFVISKVCLVGLHLIEMNVLCASPCSPETTEDHVLLITVRDELLCRPNISFNTFVSAMLTEMEPFVYLGDLVRMLITSRNYFNAYIDHKASLYKRWVTRWPVRHYYLRA